MDPAERKHWRRTEVTRPNGTPVSVEHLLDLEGVEKRLDELEVIVALASGRSVRVSYLKRRIEFLRRELYIRHSGA